MRRHRCCRAPTLGFVEVLKSRESHSGHVIRRVRVTCRGSSTNASTVLMNSVVWGNVACRSKASASFQTEWMKNSCGSRID